ncbi:MAG: hypothetical protein PHX74_11465 [Candidatus Sumerlaeales bacterium]|nr:hypothetical protein [Candidatus Sumerlaeales bacterium]
MAVDFAKQKLIFDFDFASCIAQSLMGGQWHKPEEDSNGGSYCWLYGKGWIILPKEFADKQLLFQLDCKPYITDKDLVWGKISFKNSVDSRQSEKNIVVDLKNDCAVGKVDLDTGSYDVKAEVLKCFGLSLCHSDMSESAIKLNYSSSETTYIREFVLTPKLDEKIEGCVLYFVPDENSVFSHTEGDETRRFAFAFKSLKIASLNDDSQVCS